MDQVELFVTITDPVDYLRENSPGLIFAQMPLPLHQLKQLTPLTELHDVYHILVHHKSAQVRNDVLVLELLDTLLLCIDRRDTGSVTVGLRVNELDGHFHIRSLVDPEHDETEPALANLLGDLVLRVERFLIEVFAWRSVRGAYPLRRTSCPRA